MALSDLWPEDSYPLRKTEQHKLLEILEPVFAGQLALAQLPTELTAELPRLYLPLAAWLNQQRQTQSPLLVGINGSQGSGKSTLCQLLKYLLEAGFDCRTCILSIDDLYLSQAGREQLALEVHPLLATRGVPGTHDIPLGLKLFAQLKTAQVDDRIRIPCFNKATDDRCPEEDWEELTGPVELILFEGWCVGAIPQSLEQLQTPQNSLEAKEDPDGRWRGYVNAQLGGPYRQLFDQLDRLLMLKIPAWDMVYHWRKRQEQQLAAKSSGAGIMGETELRRFIMHYERLTRHQLETLPQAADLCLHLNPQQQVISLQGI